MKYNVPPLRDFNFSKSRDDGDFLAPYTNRPISKFFSWFFAHFTLCAECVALLTPIIDILTIALIYNGYWIWAAVFVELSLIMDSADGELARFRATLVKRTDKQNQFGKYMDSMAGVIIFPLVIFSAGYFMGDLLLGLLTMLSFCLLNLSTANAGWYFEDKENKSKQIQKSGFIGKLKSRFGVRGVVGFTGDIQKHVIALALLFQTVIFLWVFFIVSMILVIIKFWAYRK